jgi:acid stress-induced BolA-like protein IbaG/YrbA
VRSKPAGMDLALGARPPWARVRVDDWRMARRRGTDTSEAAMSSHPTDFKGSVVDALREAIEKQIPGSSAEVSGGGGHFTIEVTSSAFAGRSMLENQRMVYSAIAHLMNGDAPPVHAVDSLKTRTPAMS